MISMERTKGYVGNNEKLPTASDPAPLYNWEVKAKNK